MIKRYPMRYGTLLHIPIMNFTEFLDALRTTHERGIKWTRRGSGLSAGAGRIRGYQEDSDFVFCPITAVALVKTGVRMDTDRVVIAARYLKISEGLRTEIVHAADYQDGAHYLIRSELLRACQLA